MSPRTNPNEFVFKLVDWSAFDTSEKMVARLKSLQMAANTLGVLMSQRRDGRIFDMPNPRGDIESEAIVHALIDPICEEFGIDFDAIDHFQFNFLAMLQGLSMSIVQRKSKQAQTFIITLDQIIVMEQLQQVAAKLLPSPEETLANRAIVQYVSEMFRTSIVRFAL